MSKKIRLGISPLVLLKEGVNTLAEAVKVTLGPKGRVVILHRGFGSPHVTKDGVTVAKDVELENSVSNMACTLVKQVALKTSELAGDGTTTSIVLIDSFFNNAFNLLVRPKKLFGLIPASLRSSNPMEIKKGMELASRDIIECLDKIKNTVTDPSEIRDIANISSNGDESMRTMFYEIYSKLGNSVRISRDPDPSPVDKDIYTITEGYSFDRGFASPSFTNSKENTLCILESPMFAIFSGVLKDFDNIINFLEYSVIKKRPLVVIADDYETKILETLARNSLNPNTPQLLAIKTPGMGTKKQSNLEDIVACVGYKLPLSGTISTKNLQEVNLGSCSRIISSSYGTEIILSKGSKESLNSQILFLETLLEENKSDSFLKERISKLKGKVAVISLHAKTPGELLERIDRLDDTIESTKSAIEGGYIAGGGVPLYKISIHLRRFLNKLELTKDELNGYKAVLYGIQEPFRAIIRNGGIHPSFVESELYVKFLNTLKLKPENYVDGYNVRTGEYCNLIMEGIIDPVKVTKTALENSISTSGILLTTGCTISLN